MAPAPLLTAADVCRLLGISRAGLHALRRRGEITARLIGRRVRYAEADLTELLDRAVERRPPEARSR